HARHGYGPDNNYMVRRRWDYFVRHLLGAEPPQVYQIGRTPMVPCSTQLVSGGHPRRRLPATRSGAAGIRADASDSQSAAPRANSARVDRVVSVRVESKPAAEPRLAGEELRRRAAHVVDEPGVHVVMLAEHLVK